MASHTVHDRSSPSEPISIADASVKNVQQASRDHYVDRVKEEVVVEKTEPAASPPNIAAKSAPA